MRSRTHAAARRCFLGPHRKYDPFTKTFMSLTPGQGHVRRCHPRPPALRLPLTVACLACAVWPGRDSRRRTLAPWRERVVEDGSGFDDLA